MGLYIKPAKPAKKNGKKRFVAGIEARNGRIVLTTEVLNSKQAALNALRAANAIFMRSFKVEDHTKIVDGKPTQVELDK